MFSSLSIYPSTQPLFTPHLLDWLALENLNHYIVHRLTRLGRQSLVSFRRFSNSLISPFAHYHSLHHVTSLASNTASVDHANRLQYHNSQIMQMECTSDRELTERCLLHCHPHATASWEILEVGTRCPQNEQRVSRRTSISIYGECWAKARTGEIQEMPSSSSSWNGGKCKALPLSVLAPCRFDVATRRGLQASAAV